MTESSLRRGLSLRVAAGIVLLLIFHGRLQKKQSQISILKEEYFELKN